MPKLNPHASQSSVPCSLRAFVFRRSTIRWSRSRIRCKTVRTLPSSASSPSSGSWSGLSSSASTAALIAAAVERSRSGSSAKTSHTSASPLPPPERPFPCWEGSKRRKFCSFIATPFAFRKSSPPATRRDCPQAVQEPGKFDHIRVFVIRKRRPVAHVEVKRQDKFVSRPNRIASSGRLPDRKTQLPQFRDGQLPVVQAALCGQSVLVVSPTGFGKTLCFQLPAVLRQGVSVVVCPLKALMGEQVSALLRLKIPSTFINSDLDRDEKQLRYKLLGTKSFKLLYAAPERFFVRNKSELQVLRSIRPAFLVIDEAHCIDQWGRDFRPEYGRLREVREALGSPPVLAFTATAGEQMQQRILTSLGVSDARVFVRGVDRPNISLLRWNVPSTQRPKIIAQLCQISLPKKGKVMIFVPTRKIGEALQKYLRDQGLETPFYHSQLASAWEREQLVKRFVGESRPIVDRIICTSAFGMGLDVSDVRMVIHWQHPSSVEDYLQEFGRAGRDGQPSVAVLLHNDRRVSSNDVNLLHFMAKRAVESAQLDALRKQRHSLTKFSKSKLWLAWRIRMAASDEN